MAGPGTERIVTARRIVTMTHQSPGAFVCRGEWIVATGTLAEVRERFPAAQVYDFGDCCITPGFNDAHQHPTICAEQSLQVDLSPAGAPDTEAVVAALRERAASVPTGQWIVGFGYDQFRSNGGRDLTRDELDAACPEHPVLVVHVTLHAGVVNSRGMQLAGWSSEDDARPGGQLGADESGRLTGVAHDQALYDLAFPAFTRADTIVPTPREEDLADAFCAFLRRLAAAGITSVTDALLGPPGWRLLSTLAHDGRLPIRVNGLAAYDHLDYFQSVGQGGASATDRLRLAGVKTFVDGAVNGGTCLLEEPAAGGAEPGIARMSKAELDDVVRDIHDAGWRACVHANGDRAISWALDAIEAAQRAGDRSGPRHRIEHASVMTADLLGRTRALGVVTVPFANYVLAHGDKLRAFYGDERTERMFAHRAMLDEGIAVAGSSDYPCGPFEPLFGMRSCVTRQDPHGADFGLSQRISAREALGLYTTGAAYSTAEEATKGQLVTGKLADFVVLSANPLTVPAEHLGTVAVRETWVGGERVWPAP
ncbi:amidohydrolase [Leekyejoonella antrihumi]|uniref:Amidohydrolase n=1 Tax=Leekyejoonella antrihumi TaxID=1660198 RepID=A0A563DZP1_9MICO|nr:amidohydrolase [Leekyejoonella antrihumi]TWP35432.1 amidohydrolase [Leekyejoonella antrihumi]